MLILRTGVERLLHLLLGMVQVLFLLQGLAFGCAGLAVFSALPLEPPDWLRRAILSALLVSASFLVAGFLLVVARRWRGGAAAAADGTNRPARLLGLLVPAVAANLAAAELPELWSRISLHLGAAGFWDAVTRSSPYGGILLLPIFASLLIPLLVTAAAVVSIALPLLLMLPLATRSRLFPSLLARAAFCQAGLVAAAWVSVDALARLASQVLAAMRSSGDAEVLQLADELMHATDILTCTTTRLAIPLLIMLGWLAFLRPWRAEPVDATALDEATPPEPTMAMGSLPRSESSPASGHRTASPTPRETGTLARLAAPGLAGLGALMLLFAAADGLRTRAVYVSSQPLPGATLQGAPVALRVTFGAALDPSSSLAVTRLIARSRPDAAPEDIAILQRLAADDPSRRTLEGLPPQLPAGVYRVSWQALPEGGGIPRHGSFAFGVEAAVPPDVGIVSYALQERDVGTRGRRSVIAGGALLLLLGLLARKPGSRRRG